MKPKFQLPTHIGKVPVKGATKIALAEAEKKQSKPTTTSQTQPIQTQTNINPQDYIQIPQHNILISAEQGFNGNNYETTHKDVLKAGLKIPYIHEFIQHFLNVRDAAQDKIKLYDGLGQEINKQKTTEVYKKLTHDCWTWLNVKFISGTGFNNLDLETITGINPDNTLITQSIPLEQCLFENCYVDLNFNTQGLAVKKSGEQKYIQGQNIYYWHPRKDNVARFFAGSVGADLGCDRRPGDANSSLGVFACAEGAR